MFGLRPPAPNRVTAEAPGAMPRSTLSGCQAGSDSSSAKHSVYLPGQPRVDRSIPPGTPPPTLRITSCSARPMLAFARLPWPSAFTPEFMPMRRAIGPFTTTIGPENQVVHSRPCIANSGASAASTTARTTGMYSGLQPAITALIATFSTVHGALFGGIAPITSCASRLVPPSIRSTRTGVGGTTGSPSLQPREKHSSCSSSGMCTSMTRAFRGGLPNATSRISGMPGSTLFEPQPGWKSGSSAPRGSSPVNRCHSARSQPTVRSVSAPSSTRMRVGTVSMARRHECSSERSSTASMPCGNAGSSWV